MFTRRLGIVGFIFLVFFVLSCASAATIRVNTLIDNFSNDGNGECTLREAIVSINRGRNSGFCFALSGGPYGNNDTIILPPGVYTMRPQPKLLIELIFNPDSSRKSGFHINKSMIIKGDNPLTTIIRSQQDENMFTIGCIICEYSPTVKIENITLQEASRTTIYHEAGKLNLDNVVIKDAQLGAIVSKANLSLKKVTVYNNISTDGAGLHLFDEADAYVENSTFSNNIATGNGGGILVEDEAKLFLASSTVAYNLALAGGGIFSEVNSNNVRIENSLIAANNSSARARVAARDCFGNFRSLSYNLISDATGCEGFSANTKDLLGSTEARIAVNLSGLRLFDKGLVPTHALQNGSPAIDAGGLSFEEACLSKDQTGKSRPLKGSNASSLRCDIGAYEAKVGTSFIPPNSPSAEADLSVNIRANPGRVMEGELVQLHVTVSNAGPDDAASTALNIDIDNDADYVSSDCGYTTQVECLLGTIASGSSVERIITIRAPTSVNSFTYLKTIAKVSSRAFDPITTNNTEIQTRRPRVSALPKADIRALLSGPNVLGEGQTSSIELALENLTGDRVSRLSAELTFPEGLNWLRSSLSSCTETSETTLLCTFASLAATESKSLTLSFIAPNTETNLAFNLDIISSDGNYGDTNTTNNLALLNVPVEEVIAPVETADIALRFNETSDTLLEGQTKNYELSVHNHGPNLAENVLITFSVPNSLEFLSSHTNCADKSCQLSDIEAGSSIIIPIRLKALSSADAQTINANSSSGSSDPLSFNNNHALRVDILSAEAELPNLLATQLSTEDKRVVEGGTDIAVLNFSLALTSQEAVALKRLSFLSSGTGNDATDLSQVQLFLDADNNGRLSFADEHLSSAILQEDNGSFKFELSNLSIEPDETLSFIVALDFRSYTAFYWGLSALFACALLPLRKRKQKLSLLLLLSLALTSCLKEQPPKTPEPITTKDSLTYQITLDSLDFEGLDSKLTNQLANLSLKSSLIEIEQ